MPSRPGASTALVGLLATAGLAHFVAPRYFDELVPSSPPGGARAWTYLSGVAELATAAAVAAPSTRRLGGLGAAGLFLAVFPANVKMARDWSGRPLWQRLVAYGRLPLQAPLVAWALRVSREAGSGAAGATVPIGGSRG